MPNDYSSTGSHRFALVNAIKQRATELGSGAEPRVRVQNHDKHVMNALRESEAGLLPLEPSPKP